MDLRTAAKLSLERVGIDAHQLALSHDAQRATVLRRRGVSVLLDVGANTGQYVGWLRKFGYTGRIVSFEPNPAAFEVLSAACSGDDRWTGRAVAVGAERSELTLHLTGDSKCASVLQPTGIAAYLPAAGRAVDGIKVPIVTLDEVWADITRPEDVVALKIDVQGYEQSVLDGAAQTLPDIQVLEVEMALVDLYSGGSRIYELLPALAGMGFSVTSIGRGHVDRATGQLLDIDVLMERSQPS